jgi:hypothetical protein
VDAAGSATASFSAGATAGIKDTSTAVDGVGAVTLALRRNTDGGYAGALNRPFGFFSFVDVVGFGVVTMGSIVCGITVVPFSDATILAIVSEAAAAAARLEVGALTAAVNAKVAASSSGKPIPGVRYVLMGSRSGNARPLLLRMFLFRRLLRSLSRSFSFLSSSPSLR